MFGLTEIRPLLYWYIQQGSGGSQVVHNIMLCLLTYLVFATTKGRKQPDGPTCIEGKNR